MVLLSFFKHKAATEIQYKESIKNNKSCFSLRV